MQALVRTTTESESAQGLGVGSLPIPKGPSSVKPRFRKRLWLTFAVVLLLAGGGLLWWRPWQTPLAEKAADEPDEVTQLAPGEWPVMKPSPLDRLDPTLIPDEERVAGPPEGLGARLWWHSG